MSKKILVPTGSFQDWKKLLAKPDLHWKPGYSAMTLARCWEDAPGFPPEIRAIVETGPPSFHNLNPLLAIPEYQVSLPGGDRPSQTDLFVLASNKNGMVVIAVEGKVDEPFGPTLNEKLSGASEGFKERLDFLLSTLGLTRDIPSSIRYQLIHRTASAVLIAEQFHARSAIMLVHSFSPSDRWFEDFKIFASLFELKPVIGKLGFLGKRKDVELYAGWCKGDQKFRST